MLPEWADTGDGYTCIDDKQNQFAFAAALICGFDLPRFDIWLSGIPECGMKTELLERRHRAMDALLSNNQDAAFRHLEWMLSRQREDSRTQYLMPLARRGDKVGRGASDGGKATAKWPERREELQDAVNAIHAEKPHLSYEEIKRTANRRHDYPLSALKRYTKNPKKS